MYMNGRGLTKHTEKLNNAVFASLDKALIGSFIGIPALVTAAFGAFVSGYNGSFASGVFFVLLGAGGAIVWYKMHKPWSDAMKATNAHREAMEAETAKRGGGWAKS